MRTYSLESLASAAQTRRTAKIMVDSCARGLARAVRNPKSTDDDVSWAERKLAQSQAHLPSKPVFFRGAKVG